MRNLAMVGLLVTCVPFCRAQAGSRNPCDGLEKVAVPELDRPTLADVQAAGVRWNPNDTSYFPEFTSADKRCDASDFYYFSKAPDRFRKARACVLAKLGLFREGVLPLQAKLAQYAAAGGATDPEDLYEPEGLVLTMLYANGEGVPANLPLAGHFICQYGPSVGGGDDPAALLLTFQKIIKSGKHYDVCSGDAGDFGRTTTFFCAGIGIEMVENQIARQREMIVAAASPQIKALFLSLEAAHRQFAKTYEQMEGDSCGGGTGCGVDREENDLTIAKSWSISLKSIAEGKPPASGVEASSFSGLDRKMKELEQESSQDDETLAKSAGAFQRAWLEYREAWVRFGALRWPEIPPDQWRAWLTSVYLSQ